MKRITQLMPLLALCLSVTLAAQNPSRTTLKGSISDTTGTSLPFATVMLLNGKDSTLVNFTRTDDKGLFSFKNIRNAAYILKVSYVGYIPYTGNLNPASSETNDLGKISMKPISHELMEVVVHTAKAPLHIRGDTIEYDATTFKVPPGSTVEDLLRRLPGIEVDADGNIKTQGKDVKRVYVDGKTFFGDDPKAATKNLGAETISKVQVYNEKSEQAKLTGVDDGTKEKAMNLELKEEYKKGSFGKVTAAAGTSDRWAARGNYNRFNDKQQLSFIGYGNNINQTGVNWEDYGEFKGQNSFNDFDNGDFGFSTGNRYFMIGGEESILNSFDGRGFTKNYGGGVNYNFDNKKTKLSTSYFYNQTDLHVDQNAFRQTFLPSRTFTSTDTLAQNRLVSNHSLSARLEQEIDSNDVLIVKANFRLSNSTSSEQNRQQFLQSDSPGPINNLTTDNSTDLKPKRISSAAIFRHRFLKKGRSLAVSAGYSRNQSDGTDHLNSLNAFFQATTVTDQIRLLNNNLNTTNQFKSSVLYTEPISKVWHWETFFNHAHTGNQVNRQVTDLQDNTRSQDLSIYYDNTVIYNRLGSSMRYSKNGINIAAGLAGQQLDMTGKQAPDVNQPWSIDPIHKKYLNWVPNVDANIDLTRNMGISLGYGYQVREPSLSDLQPVQNVSNPAYRVLGNPDLVPARSHEVSADYHFWDPSTFGSFNLSGSYTSYETQIVYNQTIEVVDKIGLRTTTQPSNVPGGNNVSMNLWVNYPIIKTKLSVNVNGSLNSGTATSFVNNVKNETQNNSRSIWMSLTLTPGTKLILSLYGNYRPTDIRYSIQQDQNQQIRNSGLGSSIKWQFASKFFFESNFDYTRYRNDRFGFNQEMPIWNASIRRLFGKNNRVEMRLAAFDLLNKRVSIQQSGTQNYVYRSIASTLARYYMLSVSYNIRGYENKLKKNDWW
jgi:hypothetical protein